MHRMVAWLTAVGRPPGVRVRAAPGFIVRVATQADELATPAGSSSCVRPTSAGTRRGDPVLPERPVTGAVRPGMLAGCRKCRRAFTSGASPFPLLAPSMLVWTLWDSYVDISTDRAHMADQIRPLSVLQDMC